MTENVVRFPRINVNHHNESKRISEACALFELQHKYEAQQHGACREAMVSKWYALKQKHLDDHKSYYSSN